MKIKNLYALGDACKQLGTVELRDQQTFKTYNGARNKCDKAIVVKDNSQAYEVGVIKQTDGTYELSWDSFMGAGGLVEAVGKDCNKIKQEYALAVAARDRRSLGYQVHRVENKDGSVLLQCR